MSNIKLGDAHGIPILDFGPFLDGSRKQAVADVVVQSFKEVGFIYLINHGLPKERIDGMFEWSRTFFSQPMEIKHLAPHPASGTHHRGYSAPGLEKVSQHVYDADALTQIRAEAPDVKESFECGREHDEVMPNIWLPEGVLPGFTKACLDFYWACRKVELTVLKALAVGLHLPEDFLAQSHAVVDNQLRLLHYPSVPAERLEKDEITRIGAHSDFGSITLLLQDDVGGLEVEDPHTPGVFHNAPPVDGAIIVNAGDFLMRWTNDMIRSTVHRVRAPPNCIAQDGMTPERYSIPYRELACSSLTIIRQDFNKVVDCLPGTYSADRPKKYEPISAVQYVQQRLAASYA
ncbi:thymine dioxygenase [Amylocystis lapponica]|nr:thymine dioxygenase [Amylocystis lapponica]